MSIDIRHYIVFERFKFLGIALGRLTGIERGKKRKAYGDGNLKENVITISF